MAGPKTPGPAAHHPSAQRGREDGPFDIAQGPQASTLLSLPERSRRERKSRDERRSKRTSPRNLKGENPSDYRQASEVESAGLALQQCGECLGAVAHRLSQPLTALRGSLELALRTELSLQDSRAALEQAFELTDLAVNMLRSIRELAEAAEADAPTKLLALRDLVKETWADLQGFADSRGIRTVFEMSHEAMVWASPDRLREVVAKLLWLVIQRSPDRGEIRLALTLQPSGGAAHLLIADQGPSPRPGEFDLPSSRPCGIGHLFAEAAKNRCLDWAAVKVLAESLGGTLEVRPQKSQGCCFILQLPLASAQNQ